MHHCDIILRAFMCGQYTCVHLHFPGSVLSFLPPSLERAGHSPSPHRASCSSPHPHFKKYMQNDITPVHCGLSSFGKKSILKQLRAR